MAGEAPLERQPDEDLFQRVLLPRTVAPPQSSSRADVSANAASTRLTRSGNRDRYSDRRPLADVAPQGDLDLQQLQKHAFRPGPTRFFTICSICGRGPWAHACTNDFTASSVFGFIELVVHSGCMARTLRRAAEKAGRHAPRAVADGTRSVPATWVRHFWPLAEMRIGSRSMPFIPRRTVLTPPAATRHPRLSHPNDARELSGREKSGGRAIRNHLWARICRCFRRRVRRSRAEGDKRADKSRPYLQAAVGRHRNCQLRARWMLRSKSLRCRWTDGLRRNWVKAANSISAGDSQRLDRQRHVVVRELITIVDGLDQAETLGVGQVPSKPIRLALVVKPDPLFDPGVSLRFRTRATSKTCLRLQKPLCFVRINVSSMRWMITPSFGSRWPSRAAMGTARAVVIQNRERETGRPRIGMIRLAKRLNNASEMNGTATVQEATTTQVGNSFDTFGMVMTKPLISSEATRERIGGENERLLGFRSSGSVFTFPSWPSTGRESTWSSGIL